MTTDAQKKAARNYDKKCWKYCMRLRKDLDADIVDWIKSQACATLSIKVLIRDSIKAEKKQ